MERFRSLPVLLLAFGLAGCKDTELRERLDAWAPGVDAHLAQLNTWNTDVLKALRAYCQLERNVYDTFHAAQTPNLPAPPLRYCPAGGTEPVPPPPPPPKWDD